MKMRFLGAVGVVTGSCTWLKDETRGWSFLIDCGLNLDGGRVSPWTEGKWPFEHQAFSSLRSRMHTLITADSFHCCTSAGSRDLSIAHKRRQR